MTRVKSKGRGVAEDQQTRPGYSLISSSSCCVIVSLLPRRMFASAKRHVYLPHRRLASSSDPRPSVDETIELSLVENDSRLVQSPSPLLTKGLDCFSGATSQSRSCCWKRREPIDSSTSRRSHKV